MRLVALALGVSLLLPSQQAAPPPVTATTAPAVDTASLLRLASGWTARFHQSLSGLLFHELYRQSSSTEGMDTRMVPNALGGQLGRRIEGNRGSLILEANVFLIKPEGADRFAVYRDVYRANNRDITNHTARLQELLVANTASSLEQANQLTNASARFNVGDVGRNINIPTMPYEYLMPEHIGRIRVRPVGRETVAGLDTVIVEFQEMARPTLILGPEQTDMPAAGRYWIHPASGAVPRVEVEVQTGRYTGRLEVQLVLHDTLKTWVPHEMVEVWFSGGWRTNGLARYDGYQRLAVATAEIVK